MKEKIVVPYAPVLVESTRSIGYSFEAAVADIIDNSVSASATEIQIHFFSREPQWLFVGDNGYGMTEETLEIAMRYGSKSPLDIREKNDLGRFGLGMKMASLSQCRRVTVMSRCMGVISAACWDLDYITQTGRWSLKTYGQEELENLPGYRFLKAHDTGTVVLWENFDRLRQGTFELQQEFDRKIERTREHVSLVFHRFLNDENIRRRLSISFNGDPVRGANPFLTGHPATQRLSGQILRVNGEEIVVKPYVLPFASKLKEKDLKTVGGVDDFRQHQGFYIYRNRRLIIRGTWFRLIRQNELGKLARVQVDIPNSLDSIWEIDVKKSTASLPPVIRKALVDIVRNTVCRSEQVYRYRGRNVQSDNLIHIWNPVDNRGQFQYRINRELPVLTMMEKHLDETGLNLLDSFIRMLEDTFPYADMYYRMAKSYNGISREPAEEDEVYSIADQMVQEIKSAGGSVPQFLKSLPLIDYFSGHPDVIRKIREVYANDG